MGCESSDVIKFVLGPLHQFQTMVAKLELVYNLLISGPTVLGCETSL